MDDAAFATINAFGGIDYAPHNKGITPIFFLEPVQDFAATDRDGHAVYVQKERVRLLIAGDSLTAAAHPVDAGIKARFREQYEKWKRNESGDHINGVPLSKWPMATPVMIKELELLNIFSVEDLASVSDGNVSNFTDGRAIREKAKAWLKSATDGAAAMKYAAEAQRLRDEMAELRKLYSSLAKRDGGENLVSAGPPAELPALPVARHPAILPDVPDKPKGRAKTRRAKRRKYAAWTPERRAAQAALLKARGGFVKKISSDA